MRARRFLVAAMFGVALVPLGAGAASAAPPDNDEVAGAVPVHLGDRIEQDTTQATTNAGDDALNANCGAPATNASVWYQYTPTAKGGVALDTTGSDYSTGLMVFEGTPTADSLITCGPGAVGLHAQVGKTYYIMAFSDSDVNGGNLVLTLKNAPTPHVHVSVAKRGAAFHGGAARVHGTYSCTHGESFAEVDVHLLQRAGRLKIQADSGTNARCDGRRHPWSVRLVSPVGTYARGSCHHQGRDHRLRDPRLPSGQGQAPPPPRLGLEPAPSGDRAVGRPDRTSAPAAGTAAALAEPLTLLRCLADRPSTKLIKSVHFGGALVCRCPSRRSFSRSPGSCGVGPGRRRLPERGMRRHP